MSVLRKRQLLYIYTEVLLRLVMTFTLSCLYVSRSKMPLPQGFCTRYSPPSPYSGLCSKVTWARPLSLTSPVYKMVPPPSSFPFLPHSVLFPSIYYPLAWCILIYGSCPWNLGFMKAATLIFVHCWIGPTPSNYVWNKVGTQKKFEKCSLYDFIKSLSYLFSVKS